MAFENKENNCVLITNCDSFVGYPILRSLSEHKKLNVKIRCGVRDVEKAKEHMKKQEIDIKNLEIVMLDLEDDTSVKRALKDVDRVFVIPPVDDKKFKSEVVVQFLRKCSKSVRCCMVLSMAGLEDLQETEFGKHFSQIEKALSDAMEKGNHAVVRVPTFLQKLYLEAKSVREQHKLWCIIDGDVKYPVISSCDVGRACAELLVNPSKHCGKTYTITTHDVVSYNLLSNMFTKALGKKITYEKVSREESLRRLVDCGVPDYQARAMIELFEVIGKGRFEKLCTKDFKNITGESPMEAEEWIKRNIEIFQ